MVCDKLFHFCQHLSLDFYFFVLKGVIEYLENLCSFSSRNKFDFFVRYNFSINQTKLLKNRKSSKNKKLSNNILFSRAIPIHRKRPNEFNIWDDNHTQKFFLKKLRLRSYIHCKSSMFYITQVQLLIFLLYVVVHSKYTIYIHRH